MEARICLLTPTAFASDCLITCTAMALSGSHALFFLHLSVHPAHRLHPSSAPVTVFVLAITRFLNSSTVLYLPDRRINTSCSLVCTLPVGKSRLEERMAFCTCNRERLYPCSRWHQCLPGSHVPVHQSGLPLPHLLLLTIPAQFVYPSGHKMPLHPFLRSRHRHDRKIIQRKFI